MIKRTLICFLYLTALYLAPHDVYGQGTKQDTTLQRDVRRWLDTLARDRSAPGYSKKAQAKIDTLMRAHLVGAVVTPPPPVNAAPIANAGTSCVGLLCTVNGSASRDDKAIVRAVISWGDGTTTNALTGTHTYTAAGSYNGALTVTDAEGLSNSASFVLSAAAPRDTAIVADTTVSIAIAPEIPRVIPNPTFAKAVRTIQVSANLQAALDAAQPGDSLVLAGTFTGNYVLPPRACGAGITITSATTLPLGRMTPSKATTLKLARIVSPNNQAAISTAPSTCRWKLAGLEIVGTSDTTTIAYGIVRIGKGADGRRGSDGVCLRCSRVSNRRSVVLIPGPSWFLPTHSHAVVVDR